MWKIFLTIRHHILSHFSRRVSDFSDMEVPPLEPLFGGHLDFHPEEENTPDENDLFPSTPLDEDQVTVYTVHRTTLYSVHSTAPVNIDTAKFTVQFLLVVN